MINVREAAATAVAGAAVAALAGSWAGVAVPAATIGAANGAIAGAVGIYEWSSWRGRAAFVLDSSWALPTTAAALASHAVARLRGRPGWIVSLSRRQNRHVYQRGFQPRRGFVITVGNVISGVGADVGPRRTRLVTDHENVHVWQTRWFGPLFPALYGGWLVVGGAVGATRWLWGHRSASLAATIEAYGYYLNPFEWWAYSRDGNWPPPPVAGRFGPQRPVVQAFSVLAAGRS